MVPQEVVHNAFKQLTFDREIDLDLVNRWGDHVAYSVEPLVGHGLNRLHNWLWPFASQMQPGSSQDFGGVVLRCVEDLPADGREWAKKTFLIEGNQRAWKLVWQDIYGKDAHLAVALTSDAFFSAAYCDFSEGLEGPVRGYLNGKGSEVREVFDLLDLAARSMPADILKVRQGTVQSEWELEPFVPLIEFDGRLGASLAGDLYDMAQQHVCSMIARAASAASLATPGLLAENGFVFEHSLLKSKSDVICGLPSVSPGIRGYYFQLFPGTGEFDRYLSWSEIGSNGTLLKLNVRAIALGERAVPVIRALLQGDDVQASVSHDFAGGITTFADPVKGYDHLANYAVLLRGHFRLLADLDLSIEGEEFERITDFDDLEPEEEIIVTLGR